MLYWPNDWFLILAMKIWIGSRGREQITDSHILEVGLKLQQAVALAQSVLGVDQSPAGSCQVPGAGRWLRNRI